jgi:hypothetical protein
MPLFKKNKKMSLSSVVGINMSTVNSLYEKRAPDIDSEVNKTLMNEQNLKQLTEIYNIDYICKSLTSLELLNDNVREFRNESNAFFNEELKEDNQKIILDTSCFLTILEKNNPNRYNSIPINHTQIFNCLDFPNADNTLKWIHIVNLNSLESLSLKYKIHEVFIQTFKDLRAHSSFVQSKNAFMLTLCITKLNIEGQASFFKLFIYVNKNLVLTFEIGDLNSGGVFNTIQNRVNKSYIDKYIEVGAISLVNDLLLEFLILQQPLMEICAQYIISNKNFLFSSKNLHQSEYSALLMNMRQAQACLQLLERFY